MSDGILHLINERQCKLGRLRREVRIMLLTAVAGFAKYFQMSNNGVLYPFILLERDVIHVLDTATDLLDSLQNVPQIID